MDFPLVKKKVAKASGEITLRTLLTHVQGMKQDIADVRINLGTRIDRLEAKVDHGFAQIGGRLDTIDERLTDIELIPSVTKHLTRQS